MVDSSSGLAIAPDSATIVGGFVLVPVASLMAAWRACRGTTLGAGDFRAWLACREMIARRTHVALDRLPSYGDPELARLLGISPKRARASLRRLVAAGLLFWSDAAITFPEPSTADVGPVDEDLANTIGSGRGVLAIPRRVLRFLVQGTRPTLIATILGALLRCLSRRKAGFRGWGRLKASWVARAFAIDSRAVKAARAELVALGWLTPEPSNQTTMNRWGRAYRIDLSWLRPDPRPGSQSPPPPVAAGTQSPPPDLHRDPLTGIRKNQEPVSGGPTGFEEGQMEGCKGTRATGSATVRPEAGRPAFVGAAEAVPPPRLTDVRPEDLVDADRLMELHRQAAARGLVGMSEADRLKFAAAAEHARSVGRRNPCGLFARIVAKGWWGFATLGEEERAARRLRERDRRIPPQAGSSSMVADRGAEPGRGLSSLGSVLDRLGIAAGVEARGGPARDATSAVAMPRRPVGGRRIRENGVASEERRGPEAGAEAAMLAHLARLIGDES